MENNVKSQPEKIKEEVVGPNGSKSSMPESYEECSPKTGYVDITAMIRSLQRTEGSSDCFRRGITDCDQLECSWRQYCLKTQE